MNVKSEAVGQTELLLQAKDGSSVEGDLHHEQVSTEEQDSGLVYANQV